MPLDAVRAMPMAEFLVPVPYLAEARFGLWDEILKEPEPSKDLPFTSAMWHYARALAYSAKGNRAQAAREQKQLEAVTASIPPDRPLGSINNARQVAEVAVVVVAGELAAARGDRKGAVAKLTDAVRMQDALGYDEPPIWYYPVRESLGAQLLASGQAQEAEAVYREDLKINPGNPRSLYGLAQCLAAEGKTAEAAKVEQRFTRGWSHADITFAPEKVAAQWTPFRAFRLRWVQRVCWCSSLRLLPSRVPSLAFFCERGWPARFMLWLRA